MSDMGAKEGVLEGTAVIKDKDGNVKGEITFTTQDKPVNVVTNDNFEFKNEGGV